MNIWTALAAMWLTGAISALAALALQLPRREFWLLFRDSILWATGIAGMFIPVLMITGTAPMH